jgi:DNA-binding helix-hairpin-helix protein with protein kinase domain
MNAPARLPTGLRLEGRPLRLAERLGRGGEGEVFALADDATRAVKLYTVEGAAAREAKIAAMLCAGLAERAPCVAFPQAAVTDTSGRFAGFVMARVDAAEPLHELYAPGARKRTFPEADFRFVLRAAVNTARAVAAAHAAGCVIGDVNHSGFLIGADATVTLIDADSFQFSEGARQFLCRVGVPEYTAPELAGVTLAETPRSPDHDAFALAIVLFQLLFLGRHPFAGLSRRDDFGIAEAIEAHAFAYGRHRRGDLAPPPGALRLDEVPEAVGQLFERAFAPEAAGRRPTAADWVAALEGFERALAACPDNPRHHHTSPDGTCPWCRVERLGRTALFPAPGTPGAAPLALPSEELRDRLAAIRLPEVLAYSPPPPMPGSAPPPPTQRQKLLDGLGTAGLAFMMVCAVGLVTVSPQNFLMASPICLYGIGPVGDALFPRRARRRALAKIDRQLAEAWRTCQNRPDLDGAWLLRAELEKLAARQPRALASGRMPRPSPRQRAEAARLARDLPRLETMAGSIENARTARDGTVEKLLAKREQLVAKIEAKGEAPAEIPVIPPRGLRAATQARLSASYIASA